MSCDPLAGRRWWAALALAAITSLGTVAGYAALSAVAASCTPGLCSRTSDCASGLVCTTVGDCAVPADASTGDDSASGTLEDAPITTVIGDAAIDAPDDALSDAFDEGL
jgi:hypothetical protein